METQPDAFTHPLDRPGFGLHVGDRFIEHRPGAADPFTLVEIGPRRGDHRDRYAIELIVLGACDADGGNLRRFDCRVAHMIPHGLIGNSPGEFVAVEQKALAA